MHVQAYEFVQRALMSQPVPRRVLEIGARHINGSVRGLFPTAEEYVGIDLMHGPGVDVVADGAVYRPRFDPDCVVCCEVLEHTPQASVIVRHAIDLLVPGGLFIVTCATDPRKPHSGFHGLGPVPGEHYQNIDPEALRMWTRGLRDHQLEVDRQAGDLRLWGRV